VVHFIKVEAVARLGLLRLSTANFVSNLETPVYILATVVFEALSLSHVVISTLLLLVV
jgi:hypothetical protein